MQRRNLIGSFELKNKLVYFVSTWCILLADLIVGHFLLDQIIDNFEGLVAAAVINVKNFAVAFNILQNRGESSVKLR